MNIFKKGMQATKILAKPFNIFFGSDERSFMTFFGAMLITYFSGFPDAAIILSVYSTIFAFSGMQVYNTGNSTSSKDNKQLENMENMMENAMSMAEEFQKETKEGVEK